MSHTAKSIILDIANNHGDGFWVGLRSIEFKLAGVLVAVSSGDSTCYATSDSGANFLPGFAFYTALSKTGSMVPTTWESASGQPSDQRLICVFDAPIEFDVIIVNNLHSVGNATVRGAKDVKIYSSSNSITSTVYGQAIAASELLFDGEFPQHPATDTVDDQSLTLIGGDVIIVLPVFGSVASLAMDVNPDFFNGTTIDLAPLVSTASMTVGVALIEYLNPAILFFFTLTGALDGLEDVQIPISSFQARHRSGKPSYLSVTIPGDDYSQQISDRSNGELVVRMAKQHRGAVYHSEEILRASLEKIRPDGGGRNSSITLSGHSTTTFTPKSVDLQDVSFRTGAPGSRRYRLAIPDIFLRPGDTAKHDGDSILVDTISYSVNKSQQMMEVAE